MGAGESRESDHTNNANNPDGIGKSNIETVRAKKQGSPANKFEEIQPKIILEHNLGREVWVDAITTNAETGQQVIKLPVLNFVPSPYFDEWGRQVASYEKNTQSRGNPSGGSTFDSPVSGPASGFSSPVSGVNKSPPHFPGDSLHPSEDLHITWSEDPREEETAQMMSNGIIKGGGSKGNRARNPGVKGTSPKGAEKGNAVFTSTGGTSSADSRGQSGGESPSKGGKRAHIASAHGKGSGKGMVVLPKIRLQAKRFCCPRCFGAGVMASRKEVEECIGCGGTGTLKTTIVSVRIDPRRHLSTNREEALRLYTSIVKSPDAPLDEEIVRRTLGMFCDSDAEIYGLGKDPRWKILAGEIVYCTKCKGSGDDPNNPRQHVSGDNSPCSGSKATSAGPKAESEISTSGTFIPSLCSSCSGKGYIKGRMAKSAGNSLTIEKIVTCAKCMGEGEFEKPNVKIDEHDLEEIMAQAASSTRLLQEIQQWVLEQSRLGRKVVSYETRGCDVCSSKGWVVGARIRISDAFAPGANSGAGKSLSGLSRGNSGGSAGGNTSEEKIPGSPEDMKDANKDSGHGAHHGGGILLQYPKLRHVKYETRMRSCNDCRGRGYIGGKNVDGSASFDSIRATEEEMESYMKSLEDLNAEERKQKALAYREEQAMKALWPCLACKTRGFIRNNQP